MYLLSNCSHLFICLDVCQTCLTWRQRPPDTTQHILQSYSASFSTCPAPLTTFSRWSVVGWLAPTPATHSLLFTPQSLCQDLVGRFTWSWTLLVMDLPLPFFSTGLLVLSSPGMQLSTFGVLYRSQLDFQIKFLFFFFLCCRFLTQWLMLLTSSRCSPGRWGSNIPYVV